MSFINALFNVDARRLKQVTKIAQQVDDLKDKMAGMKDEELQAMTPKFKERLANGETLDDILPEAYAVAREACKRVIHEYPYFCQIQGAVVLHQGDIAEMKTGEGKTLTSVMPVYLNALTGDGVHVVTVNEYLSERDSEWMGGIHRFLGLSVGLNLRKCTKSEKKAAKADKPKSLIVRFLLFITAPFRAIGRYFRDSFREVRQVRWPNRKTTWKLTISVIVYVVAIAVAIMLLDALLTYLFNVLLGGNN